MGVYFAFLFWTYIDFKKTFFATNLNEETEHKASTVIFNY